MVTGISSPAVVVHDVEMSEIADPVGVPRDRDKALSVAYLRTLGASQEEAARATGVDARTVGRWESCSWWPEVLTEAAERWLAGAIGKARKALLDALDEPDGLLALKVLERVVPELAPASQRMELRGALARLDIDLLPNHLVARIAAGEHPEAVLASGASDAAITPSELIAGKLAPGPPPADPPGTP